MEDRTDNIALVDLDDTVADYEGALYRDLESLRDPNEPETDLEAWRDKSVTPNHIVKRIKMICNSSQWWEDLSIIKKGINLVNLMRAIGYRVVVLTQGPASNANAWKGKVNWILKNMPEGTDTIITRDKSLVYGKVLFDDYPPYMLSWLEHRPRGLGIMSAYVHNQNFKHSNVIHYSTEFPSVEIAYALQKQLERNPNESFSSARSM